MWRYVYKGSMEPKTLPFSKIQLLQLEHETKMDANSAEHWVGLGRFHREKEHLDPNRSTVDLAPASCFPPLALAVLIFEHFEATISHGPDAIIFDLRPTEYH